VCVALAALRLPFLVQVLKGSGYGKEVDLWAVGVSILVVVHLNSLLVLLPGDYVPAAAWQAALRQRGPAGDHAPHARRSAKAIDAHNSALNPGCSCRTMH
jgi:hypothetical protein